MKSDDSRRLLAPLAMGAEICAGWFLSAADCVDDRGTFQYTVVSTDPSVSPINILVTRRQTEPDGLVHTDLYSLAFRSADGAVWEGDPHELESNLLKAIRRNEHSIPATTGHWPMCIDIPSAPTLYLIPGHVGNYLDLAQRGVLVLAQVRTLFVERDHADETTGLLRQLSIAPDHKTIIEMDSEPSNNREALAAFRDAVDAEQPCALFGVGEGTPAFCDVGSDLIEEATRLGVPVRTIGGPSSLSLALMRIGLDLREFTCLGRFGDRSHLDQLRARLPSGTDLPVVLLADGRSCRRHLGDLLASWPWTRVWVVQELTAEDEGVLVLSPGQGFEALQTLTDDLRIVVVIEPDVKRYQAEAEQARRSILGRIYRRPSLPT